MAKIVEAMLSAAFVLILSSAFWDSNMIVSILLLVFGGLLIYKGYIEKPT
jgi:hypothetical protein